MKGRPSKLTPEMIELAKNYCSLGATDAELCKFFGVASSTLYDWKNKHPAFAEATIAGKEVANQRVENSLYMKACGFEVNDKYYPPDTTSIIFWLKNRDPNRWKDVKERHNTNSIVDGEGNAVSQNELARRLAHVFLNGVEAEPETKH